MLVVVEFRPSAAVLYQDPLQAFKRCKDTMLRLTGYAFARLNNC